MVPAGRGDRAWPAPDRGLAGGTTMRVEIIRFVVVDDADAEYHRAVWMLADALSIVGARDEVVPALLEMFEAALPGWDGGPEKSAG